MSQSTGRRPAFKTAAATEKQVNAGITTWRRGDKDFSAVSVRVSAAVPDERRKTCSTPNSWRISASSARIDRSAANRPVRPCQRSLQPRGAAAGGMVRPNLTWDRELMIAD